jgi:hypothetical protein
MDKQLDLTIQEYTREDFFAPLIDVDEYIWERNVMPHLKEGEQFDLEALKAWNPARYFKVTSALIPSFFVVISPWNANPENQFVDTHQWTILEISSSDIDTEEASELSLAAHGHWVNMRTFKIDFCSIYEHDDWPIWLGVYMNTLWNIQKQLGCNVMDLPQPQG